VPRAAYQLFPLGISTLHAEAHLKISIQATMVIAAIFAAVCLGVAVTGFISLDDIADPGEVADARGFAWFWTFLASVAIGLGLLAWWLARNHLDDEDS
jgi:hypothetical protein